MKAPTPLEQRARELLSAAAFKNGCQEATRDALLNDPPEMLEMHKVKASAAVEAISRALGDRTEREMIEAWLRTHTFSVPNDQKPYFWSQDQADWIADSIASGAHLKDRG